MSNLSFVRHTGDGKTRSFTLAVAGENIGYFRTSDIHGYVDDVEVPITINPSSPHIVTFTDAPKLGADILIRRQMPVKKTYADFARGNNFGHRQVNNTFVQQLYLTQEILDGFFPKGFYIKSDIDMGGHRLCNVGDAKLPNDAVTKYITDGLDHRINMLEQSVSSNSRFIPWQYNAEGGERQLSPPYDFINARLFINGVRQRAGAMGSFYVNNKVIYLAEPLEEGDWVDVELGTEPKDFIEEDISYNVATVDGESKTIASWFKQFLGFMKNLGKQLVLSKGSTTPRSLEERFSDVVNVKDFGAVGDGVINDYSAIQNAIDSFDTTLIDRRRPITGAGDSYVTDKQLYAERSFDISNIKLLPKQKFYAAFKTDWAHTSKLDAVSIEGVGKSGGQYGIALDGTKSPLKFCLYTTIVNYFAKHLGVGLSRKGGWGNGARKSSIIQCGTGIKYENHPNNVNWAGSGDCHIEVNTAGNDIGVDNGWGWCNTYINHIFEANGVGLKSSGPNPVLINPWFESNKTNIDATQGVIAIGGAGIGRNEAKDWSSAPMYEKDQVHTHINNYGLCMFRDKNSTIASISGHGVEELNNFGHVNNAQMKIRGGGNGSQIPLTISGTYTRYGYTGKAPQDTPNSQILLGGTGVGNGGAGAIKFNLGAINQDGTEVTPLETVWEIQGNVQSWRDSGALMPGSDGTRDIGTTSKRVRDLRIVNPPIVGSDARIKTGVESIPQELLDFALSVEIKSYRLKDRKRNHYGIIIDNDFLNSLSKVVDIDTCAAFCRDVFTDADGNQIKSLVHGVELGDLWQVRYDEWQNILLEAMRRKVINI